MPIPDTIIAMISGTGTYHPNPRDGLGICMVMPIALPHTGKGSRATGETSVSACGGKRQRAAAL